MQETADWELLRQYVDRDSDEAFAALREPSGSTTRWFFSGRSLGAVCRTTLDTFPQGTAPDATAAWRQMASAFAFLPVSPHSKHKSSLDCPLGELPGSVDEATLIVNHAWASYSDRSEAGTRAIGAQVLHFRRPLAH